MFPSILLMPVHNGGAYFRNALESIAPLLPRFERVVISLNSVDNTPDKVSIQQILGLMGEKVEVYETPKVMSAVRHLKHVFESFLVQSLDPSSRIMFFFHDDLFDVQAFSSFMGKVNQDGGTAVFGGWRTSRNGIEGEKVLLRIVEGESPTSWFERTEGRSQPQGLYTNASGMIVPLESFATYLKWVPLTRGARLEYMLISHKSVNALATASEPYIVVGRHASQEGANVPILQGLTDEILYQFWLFVNHRRVSFQSIRFGTLTALKAALSLIRQLLRTFIRSRKKRNN